MKNVSIWVNEKVAPGAVSPAIASALARLRGELVAEQASYERGLGNNKDHSGKQQALGRIDSLEDSVLSAVVASIVSDVQVVRDAIERAYAISSVSADHGCAIVLTSRSKDLTGHVWLRIVDGGIGIVLDVSGRDCKSLGPDKVLEVMTPPDAAYDYVIEHRERLLVELEAHMAELSDSGAEA